MPGAVLIVLAMVLVGPVAVMAGGAVWSALMGRLLVDDTERRAATGDTATVDTATVDTEG